VLRSVYELVEREEMKIKTLERFHAYGPDDEPATHEIPFDDGEYCYARQALAAIAERDAEIERLRTENAGLKADVERGEIYYRRLLAEYQEAVRDSR
jgi:hypothetical protein